MPRTASEPDPRLALLIVRVILVAAIVTAPVFVYGEGFGAEYVGRVAASNGLCALLCVVLLRLLKTGRTQLAANVFVFGLLGLVGGLGWFNGERVHVNVINFVLVAIIASAVSTRRVLLLVVIAAAAEMVAIAWTRPFPEPGADLAEARFEAIAQFLPTFLVIAVILWLRMRRTSGTVDSAGPPN